MTVSELIDYLKDLPQDAKIKKMAFINGKWKTKDTLDIHTEKDRESVVFSMYDFQQL